MEEKFEFTLEERRELGEITQRLKALVADEIVRRTKRRCVSNWRKRLTAIR